MKNLCISLAAPVAFLLGLAPAYAQQTAPSPESTRANPANETRQLENEIEEYPGPNDGVRPDSELETGIPEKVAPSPNPSAVAPRMTPPASAARKSPRNPGAIRVGSSARSEIDAREVQRVLGSDARLIALSSLDASTVTRLQTRLHELGHYDGQIDGVVGPKTRMALEAYNRAQFALKQKLLQSDQLTTESAEQLGIEPSTRINGAPPPLPENQDLPRDTSPSMRRDAPRLPPGGAPLPPPGLYPQPTPSSAPAPAGGATPAPIPPSP
jgi:putative peptidoglycan binding protein